MLRDLYFYPLAMLVIGGMVAFALSLSSYQPRSLSDVKEAGYVLEGEDLTKLITSAGTNSEFVGATNNAPAYVRIWTHIDRDNVGRSAGVFASITEEYQKAFGGESLRLSITARPSGNQPLKKFEYGYFSPGANSTGWQKRDLRPGWQDYVINFDLDFPKSKGDIDYFGIWPGNTGEELSMDVSKFRIEVLP